MSKENNPGEITSKDLELIENNGGKTPTEDKPKSEPNTEGTDDGDSL